MLLATPKNPPPKKKAKAFWNETAAPGNPGLPTRQVEESRQRRRRNINFFLAGRKEGMGKAPCRDAELSCGHQLSGKKGFKKLAGIKTSTNSELFFSCMLLRQWFWTFVPLYDTPRNPLIFLLSQGLTQATLPLVRTPETLTEISLCLTGLSLKSEKWPR